MSYRPYDDQNDIIYACQPWLRRRPAVVAPVPIRAVLAAKLDDITADHVLVMRAIKARRGNWVRIPEYRKTRALAAELKWAKLAHSKTANSAFYQLTPAGLSFLEAWKLKHPPLRSSYWHFSRAETRKRLRDYGVKIR